MKRMIAIVAVALVTLVQLGIVIGLYVLDDLSRTRAGVNHHLMVKKSYYEHLILTEENKKIMLIAAWILLAATAAIIIVLLVKKLAGRYRPAVIGLIVSAAICAVMIFQLTSDDFQGKLFFPYALLGTFAIYVLELAKLPVTRNLNRRSK